MAWFSLRVRVIHNEKAQGAISASNAPDVLERGAAGGIVPAPEDRTVSLEEAVAEQHAAPRPRERPCERALALVEYMKKPTGISKSPKRNALRDVTPSERAERLAGAHGKGNVGDAEEDMDVLGDVERCMGVSNNSATAVAPSSLAALGHFIR